MSVRWLVVCIVLLWACQGSVDQITVRRQAHTPHFPPPDSLSEFTGAQLAHIYCQQCHQFPEPQLLEAAQWEKGVLPQMGYRLGIWNTRSEAFQGLDMMEEYLVNQAGIYHDEALISQEAWEKIVDYYQSEAAAENSKLPFPQELSHQFQAHQQRLSEETPLITMLEYDEEEKALYVGLRNNQLLVEKEGKQVQINTAGPPVVRIKQADAYAHVLSMGIMDPSNQAKGILYKQFEDSVQAVAAELRRPVDVLSSDLNEDGENDLIVSEFGNDVGQLTVFLCKEGRPYAKQVLLPEAGIRKTLAYDWNQDGLEDLLVLMAQGDERVLLLQKENTAVYQEKTLLRFPPVYGSSDLALADFDGDGRKDILYVNGDNADYSYALKPYHGIRIFLNKGDEAPQETYFYPFYGATQAAAHDFDGDGDLDIIAIAYFADFMESAASGAVYLENTSQVGQLSFQAKQIPQASSGRWLRMEVADTDQDGDEDVLLGSCVLVRTPVPDSLKAYWQQEGASILHLENLQNP